MTHHLANGDHIAPQDHIPPEDHITQTKTAEYQDFAAPAPDNQTTRSQRHYFSEPWQSSLFGCHDDLGLCLQTASCPCVSAGLLLEFTQTSSCLTGCCVSFIPVVGCFYLCLARTRMREMHHIGGSYSGDLAAAFLLPGYLLAGFVDLEN